MKKHLYILVSLVLLSCGSRKVQINTTEIKKDSIDSMRIYIDKTCALCQELFEDTPDLAVVTLYCGHIFHGSCSEKYNKDKCAICRETNLVPRS